MKMKLNDVLVKATQLEYLARKQLPVRLSYAIGRNRDAFAKEYQRYEAERIKMCEMFADKNADGKPIVENNNYQMTDEARQELNQALKRHLEFFNTQPFLATPIMGIIAAMEEKRANGADISDQTISGVKVGLIGPLAGVGDPIFWGTLRPVLAALGADIRRV